MPDLIISRKTIKSEAALAMLSSRKTLPQSITQGSRYGKSWLDRLPSWDYSLLPMIGQSGITSKLQISWFFHYKQLVFKDKNPASKYSQKPPNPGPDHGADIQDLQVSISHHVSIWLSGNVTLNECSCALNTFNKGAITHGSNKGCVVWRDKSRTEYKDEILLLSLFPVSSHRKKTQG